MNHVFSPFLDLLQSSNVGQRISQEIFILERFPMYGGLDLRELILEKQQVKSSDPHVYLKMSSSGSAKTEKEKKKDNQNKRHSK